MAFPNDCIILLGVMASTLLLILNKLHRWAQRSPDNHVHDLNTLWDKLSTSNCQIQDLSKLHSNIERALLQQEKYWQQRARTEWLQAGDKKTHFFHVKATTRKHKNFINALQDHAGI